MKKLSVKEIVGFRGKSDRSKKNFATDLKLNKEKIQTDGGGDYWVSCLSAISNSYKLGDVQLITKKREELEEKYELTEYNGTKKMYKRNINILYSFENFDFIIWKPTNNIKFLKKIKENYILTIKELSIQVTPHHVFTFNHNGTEEVGAVWFIAKLNGFKKDELGMFADILYRYLLIHFSEKYIVNSRYCIAIDIFNKMDVHYLQLENNEVPKILDSTIDAIKALM